MRWLIALALLPIMASEALAATAGPRACTTATDVANWTGDAGVCGSDDTRASDVSSAQTDLPTFTYGFTLATAPADVIDGITVAVECNGASSTASRRSIEVGMTKDASTLSGAREATQNCALTTDGTLTFGATNNLWGATWTAAEVNAANFGVLVRKGTTGAYQRNVDNVTVTITYHAGSSRRRPMSVSKMNRPFLEWSPFTIRELPKVMTRSAGLMRQVAGSQE